MSLKLPVSYAIKRIWPESLGKLETAHEEG